MQNEPGAQRTVSDAIGFAGVIQVSSEFVAVSRLET